MSEALATWDLTRWLLEQIAEDERDAERRSGVWPQPGVQDGGAVWLHIRPGGNAVVTHYRQPVQGYDDMDKLRAWSAPDGEGWHRERVLAECDVKRRILDEHGIIHRDIGFLEEDGGELVDAAEELPVCGRCVPKHSSFNRRKDIPVGPCRTVRLMALPLADRPGYREEWRP